MQTVHSNLQIIILTILLKPRVKHGNILVVAFAYNE